MAFLGIFWFDEYRRELCGVVKDFEYNIPVDYHGNQVFPVLHKDVWLDFQCKYYDCFGNYVSDDCYPVEDINPFACGDYTLVPRGRVGAVGDEYRVFVGDWINDDYDFVSRLVLDEFCLLEDETVFVYDEHWDIGHGWGE